MNEMHTDISWYTFHGPSAEECECIVPVRRLDGAHVARVAGPLHFTFPPTFSTSFRHSPVAITVTTLLAKWLWNSASIPRTGNTFFSSPRRPFWLCGQPSLATILCWRFFQRGHSGRSLKRTTHFCLLPKVKNTWSYTPLPIDLNAAVLNSAYEPTKIPF